MITAELEKYDLLSSLEISPLLESFPESQIWFGRLNLADFPEDEFPDAGQIANYIYSTFELPEIKIFLLLIERKCIETWSGTSNSVNFQEFVEIKIKNRNQKITNKIRGSVWKNMIELKSLETIIIQNPDFPIEAVANNRQCVIIHTDYPLCLEVLNIPKPWGHEGWYTGVEKRGVVKVADKYGKTELPYAIKLFKKQVLADYPENLILLKTLNPVAEDLVGDLYYEMHEEKWEVYVVTEIDKTAWPSGTGIIKAGLHPDKITEYQTKHGEEWSEFLLKDFKNAINDYEHIRNKIDNYKETHPKELTIQEKKLRLKATDFVGNCPVKVGDIVSFPVFQMHSLRHGIKVIEFQTPHYERLIVMFAQKVLTQNHWDTEAALSKMIPEIYEVPQLEILLKDAGLLVERFVDFPQFTADRISLDTNMIWKDQLKGKYHLLITITGQATIIPKNGLPVVLNHEEALFLPVGMDHYQIKSTGDSPLICLKAMPK